MSSILKVDQIQNAAGTTGLSIDSSGRVTLPNLVGFDARITAAFTSGTSMTKVGNVWTVDHNKGAVFTASTSRFVAPVEGFYLFNFAAEKSSAASTLFSITLYRNGSEMDNVRIFHSTQDHRKTLTLTKLIKLDANDYIEPFLQSGTASSNFDNRGQFSGVLLG